MNHRCCTLCSTRRTRAGVTSWRSTCSSPPCAFSSPSSCPKSALSPGWLAVSFLVPYFVNIPLHDIFIFCFVGFYLELFSVYFIWLYYRGYLVSIRLGWGVGQIRLVPKFQLSCEGKCQNIPRQWGTVCWFVSSNIIGTGFCSRFSGALCGLVYIFTLPCVLHVVSLRRQNGGRWPVGAGLVHGLLVVCGVVNLGAQFLLVDWI